MSSHGRVLRVLAVGGILGWALHLAPVGCAASPTTPLPETRRPWPADDPKRPQGEVAVPGGAGRHQKIPIGINMGEAAFWSPDRPWLNHFKQAGGIGSLWDFVPEKPAAKLDADGYPTSLRPEQYASALVWAIPAGFPDDPPCLYPTGRYVCTFEGSGTLGFGRDAEDIQRISPNRYEFDVAKTPNGIELRILTTTPGNHVKSIKLFEKRYESRVTAGETFDPTFLERIRPFKFIRFMGWQGENDRPPGRWADRAKPSHVSWSVRPELKHAGVPAEAMVELCNLAGADPWFCMPVDADDDYVTQFATLVHRRLKSDRKVYIEVSNELWNPLFPQTPYAEAQRKARGFETSQDWVGMRSVQMWNIWRRVFGPGAGRIIRVIGGQWGLPFVAERTLVFSHAGTGNKPVGEQCDALALGLYMPDVEEAYKASWTVPTVIPEIRKRLSRDMNNYLPPQKALADKWGIRVVAYEGGQGLVGEVPGTPEQRKLFRQANRAPGMYDLYREWLDLWVGGGGKDFCAFYFCGRYDNDGSWGHLEWLDQPIDQAHKYRALVDFIGR